MDRRRFLMAAAAGLVAAPLDARAQPAGTRMPRVGFVWTGSREGGQPFFDALREGLLALHYRDGDNIVLEYRVSERGAEGIASVVRELVTEHVRVIVTIGTAAGRAARDATADVPIVMAGTADAVQTGLVASLARPGGNVTGLSFGGYETAAEKAIEFLRAVVPHAQAIGVLMNRENPANDGLFRATEEVARKFRMGAERVEVRNIDEVEGALVRMKARILRVVDDPLFYSYRHKLVDAIVRRRIPATFSGREYAEVGGLLAYKSDQLDLLRRSATFVDKILRGAKPGELPVEQPTKFELVINLKTAKALGLTIPQSLLQRADQVIE
jgi:putative ABC transport system substrate-binding protein